MPHPSLLPDLPHVDQGHVEDPESSHENHIGTAGDQDERGDAQPEKSQRVQVEVHVRPVQQPEDGGGVAHRLPADLPTEVLLHTPQVHSAGQQSRVTNQLLVLMEGHQECHNWKEKKTKGT